MAKLLHDAAQCNGVLKKTKQKIQLARTEPGIYFLTEFFLTIHRYPEHWHRSQIQPKT